MAWSCAGSSAMARKPTRSRVEASGLPPATVGSPRRFRPRAGTRQAVRPANGQGALGARAHRPRLTRARLRARTAMGGESSAVSEAVAWRQGGGGYRNGEEPGSAQGLHERRRRRFVFTTKRTTCFIENE